MDLLQVHLRFASCCCTWYSCTPVLRQLLASEPSDCSDNLQRREVVRTLDLLLQGELDALHRGVVGVTSSPVLLGSRVERPPSCERRRRRCVEGRPTGGLPDTTATEGGQHLAQVLVFPTVAFRAACRTRAALHTPNMRVCAAPGRGAGPPRSPDRRRSSSDSRARASRRAGDGFVRLGQPLRSRGRPVVHRGRRPRRLQEAGARAPP